jgi:hypothetical protein
MVDPLSLTVNVFQLIQATTNTVKTVDHLIKQYRDAPAKLKSLLSESELVRAILIEIQSMFKANTTLALNLEKKPELKQAVDNTLTGCWAVYALLEKDLQKVTPAAGERPDWKQRAFMLFNDEIIQDYRSQIEGHVQGLNFVLNCLQTYVSPSVAFTNSADML